MRNINEYFEQCSKEEDWTNTDFEVIDNKTLIKAILIAMGISSVLLIIIVFGFYELIK